MATVQARWIWGILEATWEKARAQLQERLTALARLLSLFQDNVEGRLQTLEGRAVVGRVDASGATTITLTTQTSLTGLVATVVPVTDCTAIVTAFFDVRPTAFPSGPASILVIELNVNSVAQAPQVIYAPAAVNERFTAGQIWTVPMLAGTSYGLLMTGRVNVAGNTYNVAATHSGFVVQLVP